MGSIKVEPGSKWKRREDGAEVIARDTSEIDGWFLGVMKIVHYSVVDPKWREKGYSSPVVLGSCEDRAWNEHFEKSSK